MFSITGILGIIKALLGFGETVKSISGDIARVRIAAKEAETEEKRIEAQTEQTALEARKAVLVAEAPGSRWNQGFRILLSIPALLVIWKIVVYDEMLGLGSTKIHSQEIWWYVLSVVSFYLMNRMIQVAKR